MKLDPIIQSKESHKEKDKYCIFSAAKDGEALYSQWKQDQELTAAQIMKSLLPNSDWNWSKQGKPLDHADMTSIKSLVNMQWKLEIDLRA